MASPGDPPVDRDVARALALVDEACKKSSMLWLRREAGDRAYAAWHVWSEGTVLLVSGGIEQDLPVLADSAAGDRVVVTVRSKDSGARLVSWVGTVTRIFPGNDTWDRAAAELHAKRLNSPDGERQPARWARESSLTRVTPTGELVDSPGHQPTGSHAAEPPGSPAATRGRLPFTVGRPARRRR